MRLPSVYKGQSISSYILWLYFSLGQVQLKLDLSDYNIRVCHILNLRSHVTHHFCLYHHHVIGPQSKIFTLETKLMYYNLRILGIHLSVCCVIGLGINCTCQTTE